MFQNLFISKVAHEVIALLFIYHTNRGSSFLELFGDTTSDTLCATCNDDYFVFESHIISYFWETQGNLIKHYTVRC